MAHYLGIDVGTGSARACVIDQAGDIKGLASKDIALWQPQHGYYVRPACNASFQYCLVKAGITGILGTDVSPPC
jgi:ribulose kinase